MLEGTLKQHFFLAWKTNVELALLPEAINGGNLRNPLLSYHKI